MWLCNVPWYGFYHVGLTMGLYALGARGVAWLENGNGHLWLV